MGNTGLKYTAIILILLFSQKLGLRLYLHNVFHVAKNLQPNGNEPSPEGQFHLACDCLDEALVPMVESGKIECCVPEKEYASILPHNIPPILYRSKIFHSLRGPPLRYTLR